MDRQPIGLHNYSMSVMGGQELISSATISLIQGQLPAKVRLLDLGQRRLRDIRRPERIYQLVMPGFPRAFPPLNINEITEEIH